MTGFAIGSPAFPLWGPIRLLGWFHLLAFGLFVPYLAIVSRIRIREGHVLPTIDQYLPRAFVTLVLFGVLSVLVALRQGPWLVPSAWPAPWHLALGAALLIGLVALAGPMWRHAVERGAPRLQLVMPHTPRQRLWWVAVALAAGVSEEITWRAVQVSLLAALFGNAWLAALVCSGLFAAAHAVQGGRSMAVIFGFSLVFHALVALTGSLVVPMLVHAAYDVIAGLSYARLGRELGYVPKAAAPSS